MDPRNLPKNKISMSSNCLKGIMFKNNTNNSIFTRYEGKLYRLP